MASFINGEQKEFVKGSSKPKQNENLESKLRSKIKSCTFNMKGGKELNIASITYLNLIFRDCLDRSQEMYNYEFEADVSIDFKVENGIRSECKKIRGYFLSDGNEIQKLSNNIQIII